MKEAFENIVAIILGVGTSVGGGIGLWKFLSWLIEKRRLDLEDRKQLHDERTDHTQNLKIDADMWRKLYTAEVERHRDTFDKLQKERQEHAQIVTAYARTIGELSEAGES